VLFRCFSVIPPSYLRYTSDISLLFLSSRPGGATALPLARDKRVGLYREVLLPVHLLLGPYKDARAGRGVTEFLHVLLGDVALVSFPGGQQTEVAEVGAEASARVLRRRTQDLGVLGGGAGHTEQERNPTGDLDDPKRPNRVRLGPGMLGWKRERVRICDFSMAAA